VQDVGVDEEIWVGEDSEDHAGWFCVSTDPDLLVDADVLHGPGAPELEVLPFHRPNGSARRTGSGGRAQAGGPEGILPRRRFAALCCAACSTKSRCADAFAPSVKLYVPESTLPSR
jgi:hypothetical protein